MVNNVVVRWVLGAVWLVSLACLVLGVIGLVQSVGAAILRGDYLMDRSPAVLLWVALPNITYLWVPAALSLVLVFLAQRAIVPRSNRPRTLLRVILWSLSMITGVLSLVGLIQSGSGFGALMQGSFDSDATSARILWWPIPDVRWLWGGMVFSFYVFIVYVVVVHEIHARHAGRGISETDPRMVEVGELEELIDTIGISQQDRDVYVDVLINPSQHFARIKEVIEKYERSTRVSTTFTLMAPAQSGGRVSIPLFLRSRGRLEDGLRIVIDEKPAPSYTQVRSAAYAGAVIRSLVGSAGGRAERDYRRPSVVVPDSDPVQRVSIEQLVLKYLARTRSQSTLSMSDRERDNREFSATAKAIMQLRSRDESPLYHAVRVLGELYDSHPVTIELPAISQPKQVALVIQTERRVTVPTADFTWSDLRTVAFGRAGNSGRPVSSPIFARRLVFALRAALTKVTNEMRHFAGVRSNTVLVELGNAARARSYHLEFKGSPDSYMARQFLEGSRGAALSKDERDQLQAVATPAMGQRHAHLYLSDAPLAIANYRYSVAFFERTPGSMAVACIAALLALVISAILAVKSLNPDPDDSAVLLQILLAFPVFAAAAGTVLPGGHRSAGVMAAQVSNAVTFVIALVALWVASLPQTFLPSALPKIWLAIVGILALVSVASLGSWLMRSAVHSRFIYAERVGEGLS